MLVIIYGESGSGKTTSFIPEPKANPPIKGFAPEELLVLTPTAKPLTGTFGPVYMKKNRVIYADDLNKMLNIINKMIHTKEPEAVKKLKKLKALVIDDFNLAQVKTLENNPSPNKFEAYDNLGTLGIKLVNAVDALNAKYPNIIPFITLHEDNNDLKLQGKKLQQHFNPAALTNYVLRAVKVENIDDSVSYIFTTNSAGPSKVPIGFFKDGENNSIPNDARIIYDRIMNNKSGSNEQELEKYLSGL